MIYTKTGDKGSTSLVGGTRVSKCHPRVEAYGTVDELNAHVGLLAEMIRQTDAEQYDILKKVQRNLFIVQTLLATEADAKFELPQLPDDVVQDMEHFYLVSADRWQCCIGTMPCGKNCVPSGGTPHCSAGRDRESGCKVAVLCEPPIRLPVCPF